MSGDVIISFRFPTGAYHATPWDRPANAGVCEWPPSPWRIQRALLATWHTRCPEVSAEVVDSLLTKLCTTRPRFLLPATEPSRTTHYMPGVDHLEGFKTSRDKTFDARLHIHPDDEVLVHWAGAGLNDAETAALHDLVEALPYLGRAESVVQARVLDSVPDVADDAWTVPSAAGDAHVLCPSSSATRAQLEVEPLSRNKTKLLIPAGAEWVWYKKADQKPLQRSNPEPRTPVITVMRWSLGGNVAIRDLVGITAAEGLRAACLGRVKGANKNGTTVSDADVAALKGPPRSSAPTEHQHRHAHWLWTEGDGVVQDVLLWVPDGIPASALPVLVGTHSLTRFTPPVRGYTAAPLHLQGMGGVEQFAPELLGDTTTTRWTSRTPFLLPRFFKEKRNESAEAREERLHAFLVSTVNRELGFRWGGQGPAPQVSRLDVIAGAEDPAMVGYRRYRVNKESMANRRKAYMVKVDLDSPWAWSNPGSPDVLVSQPLIIGGLSHFGFGSFTPVTS